MKQKILIYLLSGLKNKTLCRPYTRENSTIVACCDFLIYQLRGFEAADIEFLLDKVEAVS